MGVPVFRLVNQAVDMSDALEVLDDLRRALEAGEIKAFACVGIEPDMGTKFWYASTKTTRRLEVIGALTNALHCYLDDES